MFPRWLASLGASVAVTTYQVGKMFLIGVGPQGRLSLSERTLPRVMGMYASASELYVATLYQLWRFKNVLEPGQTYGGYDAVLPPEREPHTTTSTGNLEEGVDNMNASGTFSRNSVFALAVASCFLGGTTAQAIQPFVRGDVNSDGVVDISDADHGPSDSCVAAGDVNDDGMVGGLGPAVIDWVALLSYLFTGASPFEESLPPVPGGWGDLLGCDAYNPQPPSDISGRDTALRPDLVNPQATTVVEGDRITATITVPPGTPEIDVEVNVRLLSAIDERFANIRAWSFSVVMDGFVPESIEATTAGTAAALMSEGGLRSEPPSFEYTLVVDPSENGGQHGAVSSVFLALFEPGRVPRVGEVNVLRLSGTIDLSGLAPGEETGPFLIRVLGPEEDGLVGPGQPVKTVVSVHGQNALPAVGELAIVVASDAPSPSFRRGDCNDDGSVDISDAVFSLGSLFLGDGDLDCDDACDSNDDGEVDISDAIATLGVLFLGNGMVPLPGMIDCGVDPTEDGLECEHAAACP